MSGSAGAPVLRVEGVSKKFARDLRVSRRHGISDILGEVTPSQPSAALRRGEFWSLRDVTFDVAPGEAVGIIGHNGAGKSTLLRILTGLIRPSEGAVTIDGATASLLELNAPFDALLTGRENAATAAVMYRVPRAEIDQMIEEVAEFAELEDVIDSPAWTYSAGMLMRLGFSVAVHARPDLLLVDEVIAVGDIGFQRKCVARIHRQLGEGTAVVLVSHDLWMIQALCQRCLLLSGGRVELDTHPNQAISAYMRGLRRGTLHVPSSKRDTGEDPDGDEPDARGPRPLIVEEVICSGPDGAPVRFGHDLLIEFRARSEDGCRRARWSIDVLAPAMQVCITQLRGGAADEEVDIDEQGTTVALRVPRLPLFPGDFALVVNLADPVTGAMLGSSDPPTVIEVASSDSRLETLAQIAGVQSWAGGRFEPPEAQT